MLQLANNMESYSYTLLPCNIGPCSVIDSDQIANLHTGKIEFEIADTDLTSGNVRATDHTD